ncbi:MAG: DUF3179 domain-containing protein [Chitinophagaceae bacterium]|nr:DUF3179 domain-containing protein [Chitinophagaceae bacterium]MBK7557863.1 DUF3179 domain-containing protein [Chitinophagaceae bacterium]MBK9531554.1 DUF3179 domain-containing protein [Chitinophagaceae bacterium]
MKRTMLLIAGFLILFAIEILRVYFIMPFPGSQKADTIQIAYFLNNNIWWFRILGLILILLPMIYIFRNSRWWKKIFLAFFVLIYATVFYFFNFKFLADKMFIQPTNKILATAADNKIDNTKLVIGVAINGQAKAYPVEIIGYHHQVTDSIGGEPVMVTYCTVCRTGRVFSPFVNGKLEKFRLVGMDHFNAMFEDAETKSWWRQATGIAVAGQLKGTALKEMESEQLTLGAWIRKYPNTTILQPDPVFADQYKDLQGFDDGTIQSGLEKRDSASWQFKSWVIGVQNNGHAKAYDWNELVKQRVINDTFQNTALVLVLENDNRSFHVWNRQVNDKLLHFTFDASSQTLKDTATNSQWTMNGECVEGILKGSRLSAIQAYQEFWHSWRSFHPGTRKYTP